MTTKTDGGPAFPHPNPEYSQSYGRMFGGMSRRDYFAAKFAVAWVQAIAARRPHRAYEEIVIEANMLGLQQADHMLAQRENKS